MSEKVGRTRLVLLISPEFSGSQVVFPGADSFPRLRRRYVRVESGSPHCSEANLSLLP